MRNQLEEIGRNSDRTPEDIMSSVINESGDESRDRSVSNRSDNPRSRIRSAIDLDGINRYVNERNGNHSSSAEQEDRQLTPEDAVAEESLESSNNQAEGVEGADDNSSSVESSESEVHASRGGQGMGFIPTVIAMGIAAFIIYTVGKYAYDTLPFIKGVNGADWKTNAELIKIDTEENLHKLMGEKDVKDTENYVNDAINDIFFNNNAEEEVVSYTYNTKNDTFSFTFKTIDFTGSIADYPDVKFKKDGGYIILKVLYNSDGSIESYKIDKIESK